MAGWLSAARWHFACSNSFYCRRRIFFWSPALVKVAFDDLRSTFTPPDIAGQPVTTPLPGGGGAFPNVIQGDH